MTRADEIRRHLTRAKRALKDLEDALQGGVQTPIEGAGNTAATCPHRAAHRPGLPARLDSDSELRAFVLDRIEIMTFPALADAVAANFPPERRVGKSALHKWWQSRAKSHPG